MNVTCHVCGKSFERKPSELSESGKNYCSRACLFVLNTRFWDRVTKTETCWIISGAHTKFGYGLIGHQLAHRFSWELNVGPIPDGLWVLHKCDNPPCVNPDHLFLGTPKDNQQDAAKKGHLPRGESNHRAKLREAQVIEIRNRHRNGELGRTLAKEFGISENGVSCIVNLKTWKHCAQPDYCRREKTPTFHKLTEAQVDEIREAKENGSETQTAIAKRFGITQGAVSRIARGLSWINHK